MSPTSAPHRAYPRSRILAPLVFVWTLGACAATSSTLPNDPSGGSPAKAAAGGHSPGQASQNASIQDPTAKSSAHKDKRVTLSLYAMSKCPFAADAETSIAKAYLPLKHHVDLKIHYIVSENEGRFEALHGESEVQGNILQLCVQHHYPMEQTLSFITCQNKNLAQIPTGWEHCARAARLDPPKIRACADSPLGPQLLRQSMQASAKVNAMGSPTILINGEPYHGNRTELAFMRGLCGQLKGQQPEPCLKVPAPAQVSLTILSDKRCKQCKTEELTRALQERFFPNLKITALDYGSSEGRALYKEVGEKHLPLFLFEEDAKKAEMYDMIARWLKPRGKFLVLIVPADFDPKAEICDNNKDDTGNKLIDCKDPTCREQLICRKELKRTLDVFVMSQCPFAAQALLAAKEVLDNFKGQARLRVHYIADQAEDGSFSALHGQSEVDENIRQLCARKHYSHKNRFLDYVWCRNRNYRSEEWQSCAQGTIKAPVIEKCASGAEGKGLLATNLKLAKMLNIKGSPTWMANNRFLFNGITAELIKTEFCKYNKGLKGCSNKLRDKPIDAEIPAGSCGQ